MEHPVIHVLDGTLLPATYCLFGTGDASERYKKYLHTKLYDTSSLRNVLSNHLFTRELCKMALYEDSGLPMKYRFAPSVDRKVTERFKVRETLINFVREHMQHLKAISNYHLSAEELRTIKETKQPT